jgi:hypothetical protein
MCRRTLLRLLGLTHRCAAFVRQEFEARVGEVTGDLRFKTHLLVAWVCDIVRHPTILRTVRSILGTVAVPCASSLLIGTGVLTGPNVLCWSSDWNIKPPRSESYFSWHQDSAYAGTLVC